MSVIIRLQNLPISAKSGDIRHFFRGLHIPDGGVHIIGGEKGIAFVAFNTDEDARIAMRKDGWKLKDGRVKLYLSSHMEMVHEIERICKYESPNSSSLDSTYDKWRNSQGRSPSRIEEIAERKVQYNIQDYLSYSSGEEDSVHPMMKRTRSPIMRRSPSPIMQVSHTSVMQRNRSPSIQRNYSPVIHGSRSPMRQRSRSPFSGKPFRRSRSPYMGRSRSPFGNRPGSSYARRSPSPFERRSRSPYTQRLYSPKRRSPTFRRSPDTRHISSLENKRDSSQIDEYFDSQKFVNNQILPNEQSELAREEQRQLEERISKALNTRFVENAFGIVSKPQEFPNMDRLVSEHYQKQQQIPFLTDFMDSPLPNNIADTNDFNQPVFSSQNSVSYNVPMNSVSYGDYGPAMPPPFPDHNLGPLPITSVPPFLPPVPAPPMLHNNMMVPSPNIPPVPVQNVPIPFTGYYVTISGLDPLWTDSHLQTMLKGIFAPQGNIKWEVDDTGFKTGTAFVKILNIDDFHQLLSHATFLHNGKIITVAECPHFVYEKYFPPPVVPPLPGQMIVQDGEFYYKLKALPYTVTHEEIMHFFYGFQIADLYVEELPTGRKTGIGFIGFANLADYERARLMHNKKMQHMYVQMVPCSKQDMLESKRKNRGYFNPTPAPGEKFNSLEPMVGGQKRPLCVVITGMPSFVKIVRLKSYFEERGLKPYAIHVLVNNKRQSVGRGFVEFSNIRDFDAALKCHGEIVNNKMICVKQILHDEMCRILVTNKAKHDYGTRSPNLTFVEKEPEKAPYIWEPPDVDNAPPMSLNEPKLKGPVNMTANQEKVINTKTVVDNFINYQQNSSLPAMPVNLPALSKKSTPINSNSKYGTLSNLNVIKCENRIESTVQPPDDSLRDPVKFEVKIKQAIAKNTKADDAFDKTNKADVRQKLTKLTPEKETNVKRSDLNKSLMNSTNTLNTFDSKNKHQPMNKKNEDSFKKDTTHILKEDTDKREVIFVPRVDADKREVTQIQRGMADKREITHIHRGDGDKREITHSQRGDAEKREITHIQRGDSDKREITHVQRGGAERRKPNQFSKNNFVRRENLHVEKPHPPKRSPPHSRYREHSPSPRRRQHHSRDRYRYESSRSRRRSPSPDVSREVVVQMSNVPPQVGGPELQEFFRGFDVNEDKMIRRYSSSGEPLGDIRVTFINIHEAERAIKYLNGLTMSGRRIDMVLVD